MSPALRGAGAHARATSWLLVGSILRGSGLARLSAVGVAVAVWALFTAVDPSAPARLPMLVVALVGVVLSGRLVGTWRSAAGAPVLPVGPRARAAVEASVLTSAFFVVAVGLRIVSGWVIGPLSGDLAVRVLALLFPLLLSVVAGRAGGRVTVDLTLSLPVLFVSGVVAAMAPPLAWVALSPKALSGFVALVQPVAGRRARAGGGRRSVVARWTARAGLPAEQRLRLDVGYGIQYRLAPALLWTLLAWGALGAAVVLSAPRGLVGVLMMLPLFPRMFALASPLDLRPGAVGGRGGDDFGIWELLPVSRAALAGGLGRHVLTVLGASLAVDAVALGVARALGVLDDRMALFGAGFGLFSVMAGAITWRRWVTGGVGWLGWVVLALTIGAFAGVSLLALRQVAWTLASGQAAVPVPGAAIVAAGAVIAWGLLAWDVGRVGRVGR